MKTPRSSPFSTFCLAALCALALAPAAARALPAPVTWENPLQDKIFYLLSTFERDPALKQQLAAHPVLKSIAERKAGALRPAPSGATLADRKAALAKRIDSLLWSDDEIKQVGGTLGELLESGPALGGAVKNKLRPAGLFALYHSLPDSALLARAWEDAARCMNHIMKTYALGVPPPYPKIDALAYDPDTDPHVRDTLSILDITHDDPGAQGLFFAPAMRFSLMLLQSHRRDYAGRFEPLHEGENAAAFARASTLDWSRYRHAACVVLGHGPQLQDLPISPSGRAQLHPAARRFHAGEDAFILISGGYVWPSGTELCEALESKRILMREHDVPENAIIIEPHARHTTTNFRNAARLLRWFGAPPDKPVRVLSITTHIDSIVKARFKQRNQREMGYAPFEKILSRPGPLEIICLLSPLCTHAGADPLDP